MIKRRAFFQGMDPAQADVLTPQGGSNQQSTRRPASMGGPAPVPPPTDPNQFANDGQGFGRGPTMPGNVDDLLMPQAQDDMQGPLQEPGMDENPMAGSSSVVLRLLKTLGRI